MEREISAKATYQPPSVSRVRLDAVGTVLGCNKTIEVICGTGQTLNT